MTMRLRPRRTPGGIAPGQVRGSLRMDDDYFSQGARPLNEPTSSAQSFALADDRHANSEVRLQTFSMTKREFIRTSHAVQRRSRRTVVTLVMLILIYVILGISSHEVLGWSLIGVLVAALITIATPRIAWARCKRLLQELTYTVTANNVSIHSPTASSDIKWAYFDRLVRTSEGYVLFGGRQWRLLPRRAFSTQDDERTFVELARLRLPIDG